MSHSWRQCSTCGEEGQRGKKVLEVQEEEPKGEAGNNVCSWPQCPGEGKVALSKCSSDDCTNVACHMCSLRRDPEKAEMSHSWRQCAACGGEANLEDKLSQLMHTYESLTPRLQDMVHRTWCGMFEYLRNSDDIVNIQIVQTWIGHMEGRQSRIVDLMKPEERSSACDIVMGVMSQLWNVTIHVYKLQRGDTIIYNRSIQPSGGTAEVVIDVLQAGGKWFSMIKTTSVKGMKVMSTTGVTFIVLNSIMAPAIEDDVGPEAWATTIDIVYNLVNLALLRNPEFKSHLPPMKVPRDLNLLKEPLPGPNCHAIYSLTKEIITILDGS